jgi:hypothetical protein
VSQTGDPFVSPGSPVIEITIGRLEIRPEAVPTSRKSRPFEPHQDLAAYRAVRERGR